MFGLSDYGDLMGYVVFALLVILGFIYKKSKPLSIIMAVYMWAIIAFNWGSADYWGYEEMFRCSFAPRYSTHEIGYMFLCKVFLKLGFSYVAFRGVIALIIVFLLYKGISRITNNQNFAFSLYLVFGFGGNASGLRYALAGAILIYASYYLINDVKHAGWKYLGIIIFAPLFHYSSFFYVLFLIAKIKKIKPVVMYVVALVLDVVAIAILKTGIVYRVITSFTNREKTVTWFQNYSSIYVSPLYLVAVSFLILFGLLLFLKSSIISDTLEEEQYASKVMNRIIAISFFAFALAICNSVVWLRLIVCTLPIGFSLFTRSLVVSEEKQVEHIKQYNVAIIIFCLIATSFVYGYWIGGGVIQAYQQNLIFSKAPF